MSIRAPFKRLILRAVLRNVSPMVIRILAVPDSLLLHEFDAVFRAVLGWDNIGFLSATAGCWNRPTGTRALQPGGSQPAAGAARGLHGAEARMTFRVEVVCLHDGGEQQCSVVEMERA